jgi:hypothetical protein
MKKVQEDQILLLLIDPPWACSLFPQYLYLYIYIYIYIQEIAKIQYSQLHQVAA